VRVIDSDGTQVGIIPIQQALGLAQQRGMDLIEVAPNATPPVCRIAEFGKYKYEQEKREREARKHQHANKLKEIKFGLNIDQHDYQTKLTHIEDFLREGMKVKVSLQFRGRQNAHPEYGQQLMQRVITDVAAVGRPEVMPKQIGRSIHMMLAPAKGLAKQQRRETTPEHSES